MIDKNHTIRSWIGLWANLILFNTSKTPYGWVFLALAVLFLAWYMYAGYRDAVEAP